MRLSPEALEFIHAPDTIDFVTRASDAFFEFARNSNDVVVGQMLSGRYVLGYMKAEKFHLLGRPWGPPLSAPSPSFWACWTVRPWTRRGCPRSRASPT